MITDEQWLKCSTVAVTETFILAPGLFNDEPTKNSCGVCRERRPPYVLIISSSSLRSALISAVPGMWTRGNPGSIFLVIPAANRRKDAKLNRHNVFGRPCSSRQEKAQWGNEQVTRWGHDAYCFDPPTWPRHCFSINRSRFAASDTDRWQGLCRGSRRCEADNAYWWGKVNFRAKWYEPWSRAAEARF